MKLKGFTLIVFVLGTIDLSTSAAVPKIIGGHETNITDVPWQLLHMVDGDIKCGGVIIGPREVLSAGHCYYNTPQDPSRHTYRAGSNNRLSGGQIYEVESYLIHPEFNRTDKYITHDIAFVRIKGSFNFTEGVQPIQLADVEPKDNETALISGWGSIQIDDNGEQIIPELLQSATLPVVERNKCKEWYSDFIWEVREDMVCVGVYEGGLGACHGDSGGPMVVDNKLVGVSSWGDIICVTSHHPSVYTSIPYYLDWVKEQLANG